MRVYTAADEEALHILKLLKDWTNLGFLEESQRQTMQRDIPCELRRTNGFLRVVLFVFTLLSAAAACGLFFVVFSHSDSSAIGLLLVLFAAACYAGAEFAVSQFHLYRYGIEEGLAALAVGFLCVGLQIIRSEDKIEFVVPAAGAVASYLLYRRFGLQYLFLAAMAFAAAIPQYWTSYHSAQHAIVAAFYLAGLAFVTRIRPSHRFDYLDAEYSVIETLLWLGLYLSLNLQLSSVRLLSAQWRPDLANPAEFSRPFYWTTFALIWLLPTIVLWRSLAIRDRTITSLGLVLAILTLATNKPYLGLPHHAWDPILLGILLTGVAIAVRRWLANGPAGIRQGFTAQRLSARDKQWINSLSPTLAIVLPNPATLAPVSSEHEFGGGTSGGGGASSDF